MKPPVKDRDTIPWMSPREIPAIKAALSAWRKLRKERARCLNIRANISACPALQNWSEDILFNAACDLEKLAAIDERLRKEAKNG